jgi:hypothetical protein
MSIADNILETNKRIVGLNFTNSESLNIIKDDKVSEYMIKLSECYEKHSENDNNFFRCIIKSVCPEPTESFIKCQKENPNNIQECAPILLNLEKCMKSYSNRTLEIIRKTKDY